MGEYIYLGMAVLGAIWLIGYIIHLRFGRYVLEKTQKSESLKHAAEFSRSYRSATFKSIADAIAKLAGRGRRSIELRLRGLHNSAIGLDLGFYAARSYSLMRLSRTGRRWIRSWERSGRGWSGRGGRSRRLRWGRRPL